MSAVARIRTWIAAIHLALISALSIASPVYAQTSAAPFQSGYRWDIERRLIGTISPYPDDGSATYYPAERYTYNVDGQLQSVETGMLSTWQNQAIAPSAWTGFTVRKTANYSYDAAGNLTEERVAVGGTIQTVTQMSSDADDRLLCSAVRMNLAAIPATGSDACTQGTVGTNGPDRITKNVYDAASQLLQMWRGIGTTSPNLAQSEATSSYTANGKREYIIDAKGNRAKLAYDGFDRQAYWYFPLKTGPGAYNPSDQASALATAGSFSTTDYEQYGYDANGNRAGLRKRDGRFICNKFDAVNRASIKFYLPDTNTLSDCQSLAASGSDAIYYSYDPRGLRLAALFGSASGQGITSVYDNAGRLASSTNNVGGTSRALAYQYDADGNRTRLTYPDNNYVTFNYDGLDRMMLVKESGSATVATIAYNNEGERIGLSGGVATSYTYDPISRLASITHDLSGTANDVTYCMGTMSGSTCTPIYNAASQVLARTIGNDAYAVRGQYNASRGYLTNGLNQYTKAGSTGVTHDDNGNLTFADGTTYGYDIENRLTSASGRTAATLSYDPLGRLNTTVSGGVTTRFLYDGEELVGEYSSAGTLLARYVHGANTDEPILWYEGSAFTSTTRRILRADHQGSIVSVADSGGVSLSINSYDEWGNPAPGNKGRFAYTGQIIIPELGLYYYKARIYNPRLGRFNQADPVGYEDQFNLYAYVANDPMNQTDPSGECPTCIGFVVGVALEAVNQGISTGKVDLSGRGLLKLGVAGLAGASGVGIAGQVSKVTASLAVRAAVNAYAGATIGAAQTLTNSNIDGKAASASDMAKGAVLGAAAGAVGSVVADGVRGGARVLAEQTGRNISTRAGQVATPAASSTRDTVVRRAADVAGNAAQALPGGADAARQRLNCSNKPGC